MVTRTHLMLKYVVFLCAAVAVGPVSAQATLNGRTVTLSTLTYNDPDYPLYIGRGKTVIVSDAVEFGLEREGVQNGMDIVPVRVNVEAQRIEFDYSQSSPGVFSDAEFNGYLLTFEVDCTLFTGASIDWMFTTLPLEKDALSFSTNTLYINVEGLEFDRQSRLAVDLAVTECPIS